MISDSLFDSLIEDAEEYAVLTQDMLIHNAEPFTIGGKMITREVLRKMNPNKIVFTSGLDSVDGKRGKICIIGVGYNIKELKYFLDWGRHEIGQKIEKHIETEDKMKGRN